MSTQLDGYSKQFAQHYPRIGEIRAGSTISAEQAAQLADVFDFKITQLSRKEKLTGREATFIDKVADLASRNIAWAIEQKGLKVPLEADSLDQAQTAAARIAEISERAWPEAADGSDENAVLVLVQPLAGGGNGAEMRGNPDLRGPREEYASAAVNFTADLVAANGGIVLDQYMAVNLQNIIAHFEMVEAEAAITALAAQAATEYPG